MESAIFRLFISEIIRWRSKAENCWIENSNFVMISSNRTIKIDLLVCWPYGLLVLIGMHHLTHPELHRIPGRCLFEFGTRQLPVWDGNTWPNTIASESSRYILQEIQRRLRWWGVNRCTNDWPFHFCFCLINSFAIAIQALQDALSIYSNYSGQSQCVDFSKAAGPATNRFDGSFSCQLCSELSFPVCSHADDPTTMFPTLKWNMTEYRQRCNDVFHVEPNLLKVFTNFGGDRLKYVWPQCDFEFLSSKEINNFVPSTDMCPISYSASVWMIHGTVAAWSIDQTTKLNWFWLKMRRTYTISVHPIPTIPKRYEWHVTLNWRPSPNG